MQAPSSSASSSFDHGVPLNLESYHEWQVTEIGFDGTEKFKIPHGFAEHLGALARKIDWMKLVGDEATYDNPSLVQDQKEEKEQQALVPKVQMEDRQLPDAGPWHTVAKHLHESLQQLNVLLDDLAIIRATDYMRPLRIRDPMHDIQGTAAGDAIAAGKVFQWVCKRKALGETQRYLEQAQAVRGSVVDEASKVMKDRFFEELRKLRELYRVRKQGETIVGDLGYKIFGPKMDQRGVFDITRKSTKQTGKAVLQVTVPGDLMRQTTLTVSVVRDDPSTPNLFPERNDEAFAYMEVDKTVAEDLPWDKALRRAQETLLCRDIYNQLFSEAVQLKRRLAVVRDGVILVTIHDDFLLRIELKFHPFTAETVPVEGDPLLTRLLREFHLAMECTRPIRPRILVDLPLTSLPEQLDSRGPLAYTQEDIDSRFARPKGLLNRMTKVAGHYNLVKRVVEVLKEHTIVYGDPQMKWRWVRCSPIHSLIQCEINNRSYDYVAGKLSYYIRIDSESVTVVTKEGAEIDCRRDDSELRQALHFMNSSYFVHSISTLGKMCCFQGLHANMNAMDDQGLPAPTLYMVNNASTRVIYIVFPLAEYPIVYTRKFIPDERSASPEDLKFIPLNYARMPGRSMCKKFDTLFSILRH